MPYPHPEALFAAVVERYPRLSKSLQHIGRQLPQFREHIALSNVQELAQRLESSPAAIVRFAQAMGFRGYSHMKALFQQDLAAQLPSHYHARIKRFMKAEDLSEAHLAEQVITNNLYSLQDLHSAQLLGQLEQAAALMRRAKALFVMGAGRSFAAAAYSTYLLQHGATPVHWLNGLCFNLDGKLHSMDADDVLLLISYAPYAESSCQAALSAKKRGAKIIAITDSPLGEIAQHSDTVIEVWESSSYGFRSLVCTMSVVQALFLLYAAQQEWAQHKRNLA